jgi:hypothetical protein
LKALERESVVKLPMLMKALPESGVRVGLTIRVDKRLPVPSRDMTDTMKCAPPATATTKRETS